MAPRPDHVGPPRLLQRMLEVGAIAFPIPQHHDGRSWRNQLLDLRDQGNMQVLRKVPLLPATYDPRQRQRSAFVDHVDHQRYATPAHPPPSMTSTSVWKAS